MLCEKITRRYPLYLAKYKSDILELCDQAREQRVEMAPAVTYPEIKLSKTGNGNSMANIIRMGFG